MANNSAAWLIPASTCSTANQFSISIIHEREESLDIREGDFIVVADAEIIIFIARVFRVRKNTQIIILYFDGTLRPTKAGSLSDSGITLDGNNIIRLEFTRFEEVLKTTCDISSEFFPVLSGQTKDEQAYIRDLLRVATIDDLLGPAGGPEEEIVGMSVRDRYLVGKLAPVMPSDDASPYSKDAAEVAKELSGNLELLVNKDHTSFDKTVLHKDYEENEENEIETSDNKSIIPSSFGFTFFVEENTNSIEVSVSWGHYQRATSETAVDKKTGKPSRCWKRVPSGGSTTLAVNPGKIIPIALDPNCPYVFLQGTIRPIPEHKAKIVTLFLVNTETKPGQLQDQAWLFQPEITVFHKSGLPVFRKRPVIHFDDFDYEKGSLEMLYRNQIEFAVGHGVSIHAVTIKDDPNRATRLQTAVIPEYEVPATDASGFTETERPFLSKMTHEGFFDMENLSLIDKDKLIEGLSLLVNGYAAWIEKERSRIGKEITGYDDYAHASIAQCKEILTRLNDGVKTLDTDEKALTAFRFANKAMSMQRVHSVYTKLVQNNKNTDIASLDIPVNRSWRPFQLAFILLNIPSLANPLHSDRIKPLDAVADLLWFPTGGGKTEAYLGIAAFTMVIRRLQGNLGGLDGSRGLSVIMRYTLRLLTLQQFQRATALLCAMEVIRKTSVEQYGTEPFTLGLWVGQKVTPNSTKDSHEAIEKEREKHYGVPSSPAQLTSCPWCGAEISAYRDIMVDKETGRTIIYCSDKYGSCEFSKAKAPERGLPVLVVDEEIYHHPPSMLIATVDKFAMMAWRGETRTLFGKANLECPRHGLLWPDCDCNGNHTKKGHLPPVSAKRISSIRPPDLIIQDEFHLISGPLGTMVGLYESAIDELSSWDLNGKKIKPKIIASTATVRKAGEQVNNVFFRKVSIFPPSGLDVQDNYFSIQRSIEEKPGRLYMGICSPGNSRPAVLIRVYVALLTGAKALFDHFGQAADPYMTLVGYFNSLRELGGMRRLAEDDIQTRSYRVEMSDVLRPGLKQRSVRNIDELTSRVSSKDIPNKLKKLEAIYKKEYSKDEIKALDIVLATNMLSVGVDISRLGLMAVNGQPKNTAEYIQATSRIGRVFPGLVLTVLTWSRPRDLSHYETFEHYHASFYKHVEAQSVTPFSSRALDRGLTGAMVSLMRLKNDLLNPNLGAQELKITGGEESEAVCLSLAERALKVSNKRQTRDLTEEMVKARIDRWVREANKSGRKLGYETKYGHGDIAALLRKPGASVWSELTVPMSMREVEPAVKLIMDDAIYADSPPWKHPVPKDEVNQE
jgi:hypothetical protein